MSRRTFRFAIAAAAAAALAACATPTPYQPKTSDGGFTESRVETGRYRVAFAGNSLTDRDTVERYLLFRAAEVTLDAGGDWFEVVSQETDVDRRFVSTGNVFPGPFLFRRGKRYGHGFGYFGPSFATFDTRAVDRFEAFAEILVRSGEKPAEDANAYDARDVIANIGPTVRRPEPE
ncbi:MAG: hypothetical protein AAF322_06510 [Pseudomonadota bacterium]